jgi:hypothetical protein
MNCMGERAGLEIVVQEVQDPVPRLPVTQYQQGPVDQETPTKVLTSHKTSRGSLGSVVMCA